MRIHANNLNKNDLRLALDGIRHVELIVQSEHGSRTHRHAFEVALRGNGSRHTKRPNTGITGARSDEYAATYDDWGRFISALFTLEPNAICGPYKGDADFHRQTKSAYV